VYFKGAGDIPGDGYYPRARDYVSEEIVSSEWFKSVPSNARITALERREREREREEESVGLSADKFSNIKSIFVRYKCQNIGKIHSNKPSTRYCRYRGTWPSLCRENENVVTKNTNNCYKESLIFVEDLSNIELWFPFFHFRLSRNRVYLNVVCGTLETAV